MSAALVFVQELFGQPVTSVESRVLDAGLYDLLMAPVKFSVSVDSRKV
jgi:hypothetical protein